MGTGNRRQRQKGDELRGHRVRFETFLGLQMNSETGRSPHRLLDWVAGRGTWALPHTLRI